MTSRGLQVPTRVALVAFLACASLAVWTLRRALMIESTAPPPLPPGPRKNGAVLVPAPGIASTRLASAVKKDPFRAERRPPTERFRLPGEPLAATASRDSVVSPFQLVGTAVMTEGKGFAMCQLGDSVPRLVRIGERVGGLTLEWVAQGRAVFAGADGRRTELRVPKAGT